MAYATAHNGGRSQTNLNFMQIGGEYPFINLLKTAQRWAYADNSGAPLPTELDSDGYLSDAAVVTNHGGIKTVFVAPSQTDRPGNYIAKWTGNGTIFFGMTNSLVEGSLTSSSGTGRVVFSTTATSFSVGISGVGSPHITDLRVFHEDDEAAIDAGEVFGTKLKERLAEANFGVIRFLNWQQGNTSNATNYASLKPESYVFYEGSETRAGLYAGEASLSGLKYTVAAPAKQADGTNWSGLQDKATVHVTFETGYLPRVVTFTNGSANIGSTAHGLAVNDKLWLNLDPNDASSFPTNFNTTTLYYVVSVPDANTLTISATQGGTAIVAGSAATGTLYLSPVMYINVGGTGDIEIISSYSLPLSKGGNSYPVAGRIATIVYDATLNAWIKHGGDVALLDQGILNGCPPTLCFRLCAELGAHPWFVSPPYAMDPITDLMSSIAAYCRDNAPSWMIPRYEGPNELWNTAGGFFQTTYATEKALAYGWTNYNDWYGKIASVLGQAIAAVYGVSKANVKTQKQYQMLLGVRTGAGHNNGVSEADERAESTAYINQVPAAQSGYVKESACSWVSHMTCATYWNSSYESTATEDDLITAYGLASTQQQKDELGKVLSDACNITGVFSSIPALAVIHANWKAWCLARTDPIPAMNAYEGCWSPDYYGSENRIRLRFDAKKNYNLGGYTIAVYNNFTKLTDATFSAEFPSNFILGDYTSTGAAVSGLTTYAWSIFLGDIYSQSSPQWDAIRRYNAAGRAPDMRLRVHG